MSLLHEEQTYQLRGLIFEVRNELQAGWSEHIYHHALERLLRNHGIQFESKPRRALVHRNSEIHTFEPDLVVWDSIILELKVLPYQNNFASEHYAQLIHYLKFYQTDLGLLVNFAPKQTTIKRVVWTEPELKVLEDYRLIEAFLSEEEKISLERIRQCVISIAELQGLGYSDATYRSLLCAEIQYCGWTCWRTVEIPVTGFGTILAYHETSQMIVGVNIPVYICALPNRPASYDFLKMKTFVRNLKANFGLLVNFGHKQLQIYGISPN